MMHRPAKSSVIALLCSAALTHAAIAQPATSEAALGESPVAELLTKLGPDVTRYTQHVMTLANPFFEGRAPGTRGNEIAQEYIEFWFKQFGLEPAFTESTTITAADGSEVITSTPSFRQHFEVGLEMYVDSAAVTLKLGQADQIVLAGGKDFSVLGMSGSGQLTAPIAFVGYSIVAGPNEYGSYFGENPDLTGKIAMILRFEPMDENGRSKWVREGVEGWSNYAGLAPKISAAVRRGAAGVIVVNPPGAKDDRIGKLATWRETTGQGGSGRVPVVMITEDMADRLVRAGDPSGRSLLDLRRIADEKGEIIDLPNAAVEFSVATRFAPNRTANMGGILRGKGALADEFIVIGSHFDHVGYGWFGSRTGEAGKIHPGADDNASGTSGMLLLAERLSRHYAAAGADANLRSVFFMGYSAEESGLNGSAHYIQNMIAPKERHTIMLNLDMIGRVRDGNVEANGTGTASGLAEMVTPLFENSGLNIAARPGGTGPSDHASFYAAGIPVMFFFSGLHEEYHAPSDVAALINPVGAVKVVDLVERIALTVADRTEPLTFTSTDGGGVAMGGQRRVRVRFGIAPGDYSGSRPGVLVGQVFPDTSAAEGGLQAGDLMTKWNDAPLTSVDDWMPQLEKAEPGDEVIITYIRDDKEQSTKVKLKASRRTPGG
ncbi:MAG: M28 family peptidase [Phycisphaeraceae bacterium]|nr:M28 family peptidase [Phycisphaeraceae bacterium]